MEKLTIAFPYYDNPGMIKRQQELWEGIPEKIAAHIEIIIVDDCSRLHRAVNSLKKPIQPYALRVFRITKKVRWNQISARNIGVHEAAHEWLLLTDIDHAILGYALSDLFKRLPNLNPMMHHTMDRINANDGKPCKSHCNSYVMTKTLYDKTGGYDEEFAGIYSTDGMFRKSLNQYSDGHEHLHGIPLIRYGNEVIADATTTEFERQAGDDQAENKKIRGKAEHKRKHDIRPLSMSFPYVEEISWT